MQEGNALAVHSCRIWISARRSHHKSSRLLSSELKPDTVVRLIYRFYVFPPSFPLSHIFPMCSFTSKYTMVHQWGISWGKFPLAFITGHQGRPTF